MEAATCRICTRLIAIIELDEGRCPSCAIELEHEHREEQQDTERNRVMDW